MTITFVVGAFVIGAFLLVPLGILVAFALLREPRPPAAEDRAGEEGAQLAGSGSSRAAALLGRSAANGTDGSE
jgi:hypothetical protein